MSEKMKYYYELKKEIIIIITVVNTSLLHVNNR